MNQKVLVLLYSKYSQNCKAFMDFLNNTPLDFTNAVGLNAICIDNEDVRDRISKSKNIEIKYVPSILIIYPEGVVEKYDGNDAFTWAQQIIMQNQPPPPPPQPVHPPIPQHQVVTNLDDDMDEYIEKKQRPKGKHKYKNKYIESESSEDDELDNWVPQSIAKKESPKKITKNKKSKVQVLKELTSESEEDVRIKRPPKSVRTGPYTYELTDDFGDSDENERMTTKQVKQTTKRIAEKKGDIMSAAQAMQKDRDAEMDKNKTVNGVPIRK